MAVTNGGETRLRRRTVSGVVTPIFTDEITDHALGLAVDIANHEQATLIVVGMEEVPEQTPLVHPWPSEVSRRRARRVGETARKLSISPDEITTKSLVGHDLARMILSMADNGDRRTILLEQTNPASSMKSLLKDPVSTVFESGRSDIVLTTGADHLDSIGSILVPIAGGPHSGLAVDVAVAIAAENDAWIDLFHVIDPETSDDDREKGNRYLEAALDRLDDFERVDTWIYEAETVAEAIIEQTPFYDITIIGAPRQSRLRRFIFGSKTKEIQQRADSTVITVHAAEHDRSSLESFPGRLA